MRRFIMIIVMVIGIGAFWLYRSAHKPIEAVQVTQGLITQTIVATGKIIPPATIDIASLFTANIARVLVDEGDQVMVGQPLIILSDQALEASALQAQSALQETEERLMEVQALTRPLAERTLAQAQASLALAKAEYQRNLELDRKKMIAPQALEQSKRTLDTAQASLDSAQLQLSASQESGISSRLLNNKRAQAKAALAQTQAKLDQLILVAPSQGMILSRNAEVGATAQVGKPLLTLAMQGVKKIELPIDEKNIRYLHLDQTASVIADAYPKQPFVARLSFISPLVDADRATINTKLIIDNPPDFLRHNMTVSVEIPIQQADHALTLPSDVIQDRDSDEPWVWRISAMGKTERVKVILGIRGVGDSQIVSGLSENDWIVSDVNQLKTLKEGMSFVPIARVKANRPVGFDVPNGFK